MKLGIIFGGKSKEHDVSIVSGTSIIENINKEKYEIYPIYISSEGKFYKYTKDIDKIKILNVGDEIKELELIPNIMEYLKNLDLVFPVLHGLYGEDGTIQGLLELLGVKYVGCHVLASSLCMDKIYTKIMFEKAGINTAKGMYLKKEEDNYIYITSDFNKKILDKNSVINEVSDYLNFPVFIKPSNQGSSIGFNKATNGIELIKYLEEAFLYDEKVLVEEEIKGREVECAILGNNDLIASTVGEVLANGEFYTFDSKYKDAKSSVVIPANVDDQLIKEIQELAKKAYLACDCKGLSRVDFFIENNTNKIYLNEINTLPGFTSISMYPKLIENFGISYRDLIDKLISLAQE